MSYTTPDFESFYKFYPNFAAQSQAVGRVFLEATTSLVKEQTAVAEKMIDYGARAMRVPQSANPSEIFSQQVELQGELFESLGGSAERMLTIAGQAGEKAMHAWMELATPAAGADEGTDA